MKNKSIIVLVLVLLVNASCMVQEQQFGNYENQEGEEVVYDKGKDIYLFWDQVPLQKVDKNMQTPDYEKVVKRNVFDAFVTFGTMGIVSYYTVKIKTKESEEQNK